MERKKKKEKEERKRRRIMPSLVATTSTPARKPFVRTHYVRTNFPTIMQMNIIVRDIRQKATQHDVLVVGPS